MMHSAEDVGLKRIRKTKQYTILPISLYLCYNSNWKDGE